jgi:squalene cyclase
MQKDLAKDIISSYHRAVNWLLTRQIKSGPDKGGFYIQMPGPKFASVAYTGLVASAIAGAPEQIRRKYEKPLTEMIQFIIKRRNPDGSFGENRDFYRIYTTSIAMLALHRYNRIKYRDIIRDAWYFLKESQVKEGLYEGGFGYGDRKGDKTKKLRRPFKYILCS